MAKEEDIPITKFSTLFVFVRLIFGDHCGNPLISSPCSSPSTPQNCVEIMLFLCSTVKGSIGRRRVTFKAVRVPRLSRSTRIAGSHVIIRCSNKGARTKAHRINGHGEFEKYSLDNGGPQTCRLHEPSRPPTFLKSLCAIGGVPFEIHWIFSTLTAHALNSGILHTGSRAGFVKTFALASKK